MRSSVLVFSLLLAFSQTACSSQSLPVQSLPPLPTQAVRMQPVVQQPLQMAPAQTVLGLQGEEVELSGIYRVDRQGARLILRNGQELRLLGFDLQPVNTLPGVPDRMQIRVRGVLRSAPQLTALTQQNLALQVAGVARIMV